MGHKYYQHKALNLCTNCGRMPSWRPGASLCQDCKKKGAERYLANRSKWLAKRHGLEAERKAMNLCTKCGRAAPWRPRAAYCQECKMKWDESQRRWELKRRNAGLPLSATVRARRLRMQVITAYGSKCMCCGESNPFFLSIDHIENNGAEHRQAIGLDRRKGTGFTFYSWLRQRGFPKEGLQLLCFNCNAAKGMWGGICPHVREPWKLSSVLPPTKGKWTS